MELRGFVDTISRRLVEGWAIRLDGIPDILQIEIEVDGVVRGRVDVNIERPDLKEIFSASAGCPRGFRFVFDPPLSPFRSLDIAVKIVGCDTPLKNQQRHIPAPRLAPVPIIPVVVLSAGRSGTTLLMKEFLSHPEITVANLFPYEIKLCGYYIAAFRALVANEDRENSTDPDCLFEGPERHRIGHNPYNSPGFFKILSERKPLERLFENEFPQKLAGMFRDMVIQYYRWVGFDQNKAGAKFFAEKGDLDETYREGLRFFFPQMREIIMVRDPRDLLCSYKAFWKLTTDEALHSLTHALGRLTAIAAAPSANMHILRYEHLLQAPEVARNKLYAFIGATASAGLQAGEEPAIFERHATSRIPEASIARWRRELSQAEIAACDDLFRDYMQVFDYLPGKALA